MNHAVLTLLIVVLTGASTAFGARPPITDIVFAPDGDSLITASQAGVRVYSWPDLKRRRIIECSAANLHCLTFSPSGKHLAVGGGNPSEDGHVEIFSWPAGEQVGMVSQHEDSVRAVVWPRSTRLLSAGMDRRIEVWKLPPAGLNSSIQTLTGHSRSVSSLCLLNDQVTLVSAGDDQSLRVWNLETGELIRSLNQHTGVVHDLALRPASEGLPMAASASGDRTIRFWQPTIGRMVRYVRLETEPLSIHWWDEDRILAACVDGHVRVIHADEVKVVGDYPAVSGWAYSIAVHPDDGSIAVGGTSGQIRRIDLSGLKRGNGSGSSP